MTKKMKVDRENFDISRLKLDKRQSAVEIFYTVENRIGKEIYYDTQRIISKKIPHPDLTTRLLALKPVMLTSIGRVADEKEMSNFGVRGIAVSGVNSKGVIIMGTYKCLNETVIAIVTPRIKLDDDVWGFEEELTQVVKELADEAYAYIFDNKQAHLEIEFGGSDE